MLARKRSGGCFLTTKQTSMSYLTEDPSWVTFYPKFSSGFYIEKAGYFDERPEIHTTVTQLITLVTLPFLLVLSPWWLLLTPFLFFGWGQVYLHLPIKTGIQDCDSAAWGVNFHGNMIWFYIGGEGNFEGGKKWKTITMPWDPTWVRTSTLMKDGTWWNETKKNRKPYESDPEGVIPGGYEWLNKNRWTETHPYLDEANKTVVNATIGVSEREWRPLGLRFTKLFSKVRRSIDIAFDEEVGKEKGSWKGGVLGCGYGLLPGETPVDCLRRMEKERKF